jgi:hypothetical protein
LRPPGSLDVARVELKAGVQEGAVEVGYEDPGSHLGEAGWARAWNSSAAFSGSFSFVTTLGI